MSDVRKKLAEKFKTQHRYSNFGATINTVEIDGFRGISESVHFNYPVTAITGLNGAGKSTVGQLCLCAYRLPSTSSLNRYYVRDFFPSSAADPNPFTDTANVKFHYQTDKAGESKSLTVRRAQKEWSGYKRQPERNCFYVGFTVYIPKVERRDFSIYGSSKLELTDKRLVENGEQYVGRILGCTYSEVHFQGIKHKQHTAELGIVARYGYSYSENNMGFGEGRVVYTVDLLERSPEQSLFVIEEPETSLHESAQYELVEYLLDVANRRHHQIILTTHSAVIMDALPPSGRKFLHRDTAGVRAFDNFSSNRVKAALSNGYAGRVILIVEDAFAETMIKEIIRQHDPNLLKSVAVTAVGDKSAVRDCKRLFDKVDMKSVGIRDADTGPDEQGGLFSLPGTQAPEIEVFQCPDILEKIKTEWNVDFAQVMAHKPDLDHHKYVEELAALCEIPADHVKFCVVKWFLDLKGKTWSEALFAKLSALV